ncbi:hypothetical protein DR104_03245 [Mycoplasma hyorhinis]|nr:hypothetical protein [Mesomycoplasma hyorhinis]
MGVKIIKSLSTKSFIEFKFNLFISSLFSFCMLFWPLESVVILAKKSTALSGLFCVNWISAFACVASSK